VLANSKNKTFFACGKNITCVFGKRWQIVRENSFVDFLTKLFEKQLSVWRAAIYT
tara:strand:- start:309 stop:473 length:165 start_codon:yes stop_codon:yes gene_type:complete